MEFDWDRAVEINRDALLRILATLFSMAGLTETAVPTTLPRHRFNAVRHVLKIAESALRRLIVIAARDLADIPRPVGVWGYFVDPGKAGSTGRRSVAGSAKAVQIPLFPLTDPPKVFSPLPMRAPHPPSGFPRISFFGPDAAPPSPVPPGWYREPSDELDAAPLCRRLLSARRALNDLQGEATRLARLQARRDRNMAGRAVRRSPLRVGRPPGHRARRRHEADEVLAELHLLSGWTLSHNTS